MRLMAITWLGLALVAAPGGDTFQAGDWKGRANFNGAGDFTDCTVLLSDPAHTTLGFVMTQNTDLGMLVADPSLKLNPGEGRPVVVHMDGLDSVPTMADVVAETGVLIPLEKGSAMLGAIREGRKFRVSIENKEFALQRAGTAKALEALSACIDTHRGKSRIDL